MEENENKPLPQPSSFDYGCSIVILVIILFFIIWAFTSCTGSSTSSNSIPCQEYNLSRYANSVEDLLITHEATGVITNRYLGSDKYVVEVNSNRWQQAGPEQRSLIRCCAKEKAKQNGLKPLVIDEKGIDY